MRFPRKFEHFFPRARNGGASAAVHGQRSSRGTIVHPADNSPPTTSLSSAIWQIAEEADAPPPSVNKEKSRMAEARLGEIRLTFIGRGLFYLRYEDGANNTNHPRLTQILSA
ncbi:MAG TPA: hypothetical protein ENN07_06085 [candidate division Zixibacteria bacterium]|nr:hypothetical protein [candidate division Zixibacteria bacterium]